MAVNVGRYYVLKGAAGFCVASIIFIAAGYLFGFLAPSLITPASSGYTVSVEGRVVALTEKNEGYFYPVVEFTPPGGITVSREYGTGSRPAAFTAGQAVRLAVNPEFPDEFIIDTGVGLVMMKYVFRLLGIACLLVGVPVLVMCFVPLFIRFSSPGNIEVWRWWTNFIGGMAGALSFALPSALIYPIYLFLPPAIREELGRRPFGLVIFTAVGVAVSAAVFFVARAQLRGRPRWRK